MEVLLSQDDNRISLKLQNLDSKQVKESSRAWKGIRAAFAKVALKTIPEGSTLKIISRDKQQDFSLSELEQRFGVTKTEKSEIGGVEYHTAEVEDHTSPAWDVVFHTMEFELGQLWIEITSGEDNNSDPKEFFDKLETIESGGKVDNNDFSALGCWADGNEVVLIIKSSGDKDKAIKDVETMLRQDAAFAQCNLTVRPDTDTSSSEVIP